MEKNGGEGSIRVSYYRTSPPSPSHQSISHPLRSSFESHVNTHTKTLSLQEYNSMKAQVDELRLIKVDTFIISWKLQKAA